MLNGTVMPIPSLKLLRLVCKNFAGQALLTDVILYVHIAFLFNLLHQRYTLSFNAYCSFTYLRSHSLSLQTVDSSINAYRYSYFINIPFLWNTLPAGIVSLSTASQFQQSIHSYFHLANFCT